MNHLNRKAGVAFRRRFMQAGMFTLFKVSAAINGAALLVVVYFLVARGWRAINWTFLSQPPMDSMTKGGILPCIVGTLWSSAWGAIAVALPIGVASAVYLNEYARPGRIVRPHPSGDQQPGRGPPRWFSGSSAWPFLWYIWKMGVSILAGSLTLGVMTPAGHYRFHGRSPAGPCRIPTGRLPLGLGATKWQNHPTGGPAGGPPRNSHRYYPGAQQGRPVKPAPHHVYGGGFFHTVAAHVHI